MYEIEKGRLFFPTKEHKEFINFMHNQCCKLSIAGFVKGSLVNGTAKKYSDVDLVITGLTTAESVDSLLSAYGGILLSENFSTTATYMVIYDCGLAVEYDIRKTITKDDFGKSYAIGNGEHHISDLPRNRIKIESLVCPRRDKEYSSVMIAQMCCAKLLCQKERLSRVIYCDRMISLLGANNLPVDFAVTVKTESLERYVNRLKQQAFAPSFVRKQIENYFNSLFNSIENMEK